MQYVGDGPPPWSGMLRLVTACPGLPVPEILEIFDDPDLNPRWAMAKLQKLGLVEIPENGPGQGRVFTPGTLDEATTRRRPRLCGAEFTWGLAWSLATGGPASTGRLATILKRDKSTIGYFARRLRQAGLATRLKPPNDGPELFGPTRALQRWAHIERGTLVMCGAHARSKQTSGTTTTKSDANDEGAPLPYPSD